MRVFAKLIAVIALASAVVFVNTWLGSEPIGMDDYTTEVARVEPLPPEEQEVSSRLLFGGDVFWGRLFERREPENYKFPFSGLDTLNKEEYDAWIANVECPITDEVVAFDLQWEAIQFNCRPEYLPQLAKWFDVVSLANNHTDNVRGEEGLLETRANLESSGIQHFGHYEPGVLEDLCEIISLPATITYDDESSEKTLLPIAMCGYHGVFRTFTDEELAHLKNYSRNFITIAMPHAGAEYQPGSDPIRQQAYRTMIDHGADAVIGNHPHWVQSTEAYKGKLIVYSMGNLIFDQEFNQEVTRSAMIDMTLTIQYSDSLGEYLAAVAGCSEFKDDCLEQISQTKAWKPDVAFSYDVVATRTTGLVTKSDDVGRAAILERMNWTTTLSGLEGDLLE